MESGIYIIKSTIGNRVYIGQSININARIINHKKKLKAGTHANRYLQRYVNKYGFNKLKFSVIEKCENHFLNERESYWIFYYNSCNEGFNCTTGGEDNPMNHAKNRLAVSEKLKGLIKSKEWVKKIHDNIDKEKTFNTRVANGLIKKVYAYDVASGILLHECYGFIKMGRYFKINESNVRQCIYGTLKSAKGIHFSIIEKTKEEIMPLLLHKSKSQEYRNKRSEMFSGSKNPMFGKVRLDMRGSNGIIYKKIQSGWRPARKIKITECEIIELYKKGLTQKEIATKGMCTQVQISTILRQNGIKKFTRKAA